MLIVLYGLTGDIGELVREYLNAKGFDCLKKLYYSTSEEDIQQLTADGNTVVASLDDIINCCDYYYTINHRTVGYYKKDFEAAVQGSESLYMTFSGADIGFLKRLKGAYGHYVTTVYSYLDDDALRTSVKKYSKEGIEQRIEASLKIKSNYIENISMFDKVLIYGGESSVFNFLSMEKQIDDIIHIAKNKEIMENSRRKVQLPYVGSKDYIFISYSHKDTDIVEDYLHVLQRNGYRVWYDNGIKGGEDWKKVLREKIRSCKIFMVFTSKNSTVSEDVKIEIITADIYEKKTINIKLDDSQFVGTIENILHNLHAVYAGAADFEDNLVKSLDESVRETGF